MVLIMSQYGDNSTVYICRWLLHWGVPFERIDLEETYELEGVNLNKNGVDFIIRNGEKRIKMSEVRSVWYRRGDLNFTLPDCSILSDSDLQRATRSHLKNENATLAHFFYHLMREKPHIGTFHQRSVNKLRVLYEAIKLGIAVPKTIISTQKEKVVNQPLEELITKCIYEGFKWDNDLGKYILYTEKVNKEDLHPSFFPSLFQECVQKEADIRTFYLAGKFYSMAIRSQSNEQTTTDFRKYLKEHGNRCFPFQLPANLEQQLHQLMQNLELNTGSIDIIFTKDGRFIFLEVNPVGQFGMTSVPCNYNLEKIIAKHLAQPILLCQN